MLRFFWLIFSITLAVNIAFAEPSATDPNFEKEMASLKDAIVEAKEGKDSEQLVHLYEQLIQLTEIAFGPESIEVAAELKSLGDVFYKSGRYDQALPIYQRALAINEKSLRSEHLNVAKILNNLANTYDNLAQYDQALLLYERALAIRENTLGTEHLDVARTLNNLAGTYDNLAQYDQALLLYERALAIYEKVLGAEHPDVAMVLRNLAITYDHFMQHDRAVPLYQRALAIREKALGPEHPEVAFTLSDLASAYSNLAQYAQALPLYERALAIREKALGPVHPDVVDLLNNIAESYTILGQYAQALPLHQRELAIREKSLGSEHLDVASTLNCLAIVYGHLAQYDQALPLVQRALAIQEKALGPEHRDVAMTLNNLAIIYRKLAQYDQALLVEHRALSIIEKALDSQSPDMAYILNGLGNSYYLLAQFDRGLQLYQRALAIREKSLSPEHPGLAMTLNNLANSYFALAQYDQALPLYQRALAIREKVLGPEHPEVASILNGLALIYDRYAQYDRTLPLYQRALAILEKALGAEHPDVAELVKNIAITYDQLAQYDQALPLYQRALSIYEKTLGPDHTYTGNVYYLLGRFYHEQELSDLAITFYKLAVNVGQSTRERVRRIGIADFEIYTRSVETVYQDLAAILTEQGRLAEAQEVLELLKEDELFEFVRRSETKDWIRHKIQPTPAEQRWITQYRAIADRLFALGQEEKTLEKISAAELTAAQRQRLAQIKADLSVANQAFTHFMGELKNEALASKTERSADVEQLSQTGQSETREILQVLGDEVALVQYFVTDTELGMLVTTARLQKSYKTKIAATELNLKIGSFLGFLKERKSQFPQKLAEELYQLLFAPMAADLAQAGIRVVMISGDGALRYVPFAALHDGKDYLIARYALPTYTSVMRHKLREPSQSVWTGAGLGVTQAHGDLKALPAVRDELYSIMGPAIPGEIYLDQAFTAKRLQEVGRQRLPVVHIASHFQFSPGTELNSFLLLGDGETLSLGSFRTGDYQLSGVDLLTLSACETGLGFGRDKKGREIEGFGVIAQQKGAKAVIATLWPVEDTSTSMLMAAVYRNRQTQGLTKIEALRQAQLSLKKQAKYAHPYYWAPFILMGNWK